MGLGPECSVPFLLSTPAMEMHQMPNTFTCQAQARIRCGAQQQGNEVVHAGGQRADHITLPGDCNAIDLMELLIGTGHMLNFAAFNCSSSRHSVH